MCDLDTATLIAEFKKSANKGLKPQDVLRFNGMSWDYMTMALVAPDVSTEDRTEVIEFARKALLYAAAIELGLLKSIGHVFTRKNPIRTLANLKLPPEPGPTGTQTVDFGEGPVKIDTVPMDQHRVERRRMVTANVFLRVDKDRAWIPTRPELEEIYRKAGVREHQAA